MDRSHLEGNGTGSALGLPSSGGWCQAFRAVTGTNSRPVASVRRNKWSPRSYWACRGLVCSIKVDACKNLHFNQCNFLTGRSKKKKAATAINPQPYFSSVFLNKG